jgi:8-oxo-dGTP pyrophosphatase MutT (NUDIX family)
VTELLEEHTEDLRWSGDLARVAGLLDGLRVGGPQEELRRRMGAFLAAHPDALLRTCAEGHFTGSGLVLDHRGRRVLLLFHRKLQRWLQPGGHADGDANLAAVALREAREETGVEGLRVDPHPVDLDIHRVRVPRDGPHDHLDVRFLVVAPPDALLRANHESEDLRWFAPDELDGLGLDAGTHRLVAAARARFGV